MNAQSSVQFKMVSMHLEKPVSLISFPNVAFETWNGSRGHLIDDGPLSSFQGRSSSTSSFHASLSHTLISWSSLGRWYSHWTETGFDVKASSNWWWYYRQVVSLVMMLQTGCKSGDDVRVHHTGGTVDNSSYLWATIVPVLLLCFSVQHAVTEWTLCGRQKWQTHENTQFSHVPILCVKEARGTYFIDFDEKNATKYFKKKEKMWTTFVWSFFFLSLFSLFNFNPIPSHKV